MKRKLFSSMLVMGLVLSSLSAIAETVNAGPSVTVREEVIAYRSELEAKYACQSRAELYLKKYEDVVCEPILKTNIRTLHWNTIVADSIYAGSVRSVYEDSSTSDETGSSVLSIEATTFTARSRAQVKSTFRSASSSHTYEQTDRPVYSTVHKSIPQYRDEVVESYGYRILTSVQALVINLSGANDVVFESGLQHATAEQATAACREYAAVMTGFRIVGTCNIAEGQDGTSSWTFNGKNYFQK